MYLIRREDEDRREMTEARAENDWRRSVFAADLPHGLERYKKLFPPEDTIEAELGGPIEEVVPKNEQDIQKLRLDLMRAGFEFAE